MDQFGVPVGQLLGIGSGWAIVCLGVIAIFRGWLVPKPFWDRQVHEANEWRASDRIKDQAILTALDHLQKTTESQGETLHSFIASAQRAAPTEQGASDVAAPQA